MTQIKKYGEIQKERVIKSDRESVDTESENQGVSCTQAAYKEEYID